MEVEEIGVGADHGVEDEVGGEVGAVDVWLSFAMAVCA